MIERALFNAAVQALGEVLRFEQPADAVLSAWFRASGRLGRRDRAFIADNLYLVLRRLRSCEWLAGSRAPRGLLLVALNRLRGVGLAELDNCMGTEDRALLLRARGVSIESASPAVRAELPDWLYERLAAESGEAATIELGRSLQQPAPLDLRVNTLKSDRDTVLAALAADGMDAVATPLAPTGVRLAAKPALERHRLFLDGHVEVQDEASQIVALLLAPRRREMVVDFCAGAGGKTLALGMAMRSQGRLYAFDVSQRRLRALGERLARSGLSNVYPQSITAESDPRIRRLHGKIDAVLIDAPCTGFGTVRRNPDLKWRRTPTDLGELVAKQNAILAAAAQLVKPGGRLVYATCSLLEEENAQVVDAFLAASGDFERMDACAQLQARGVPVPGQGDLRLSPASSGTDGFYAALLFKRGATVNGDSVGPDR